MVPTLADLSAAHLAILDAITRVPVEPLPEIPDDDEDQTRYAWIGMGALELQCPDDFAAALAKLLEFDLVTLWEVAGNEPVVTLTPYGAWLWGITIGERIIREREEWFEPIETEQGMSSVYKSIVRVIAEQVPYWVRRRNPMLKRKIHQPKYAHERPMPFPERVEDKRKGPLEQLIDAETEKPVILCGVPVFVDPRLARKRASGKGKGKRRKAS